jgi:hypothetical protein
VAPLLQFVGAQGEGAKVAGVIGPDCQSSGGKGYVLLFQGSDKPGGVRNPAK